LKSPLLLVILDGWGLSPDQRGNAIRLARTPNFTKLQQSYPYTVLQASGKRVGLPEGQMGNSEVGHLNMGAGRVVYQDITRISMAIKTGEFCKNPVLIDMVQEVKEKGTSLHLFGLLSDGGVHSHLTHLYALLEMARRFKLGKVYIHAFLDGRDVPPTSGLGYIKEVEQKCREMGVGEIATVSGRYYAMDRDKRWERLEKAFNAICYGEGERVQKPSEAVERSYADGVTDEFVVPKVVIDQGGNPIGRVQPDDGVIFYNFRADRAREITRAFVDQEFEGFSRRGGYPGAHFVCMTQYDATIPAPVAFPPQVHQNTLGDVLAGSGLKQLRIAETEKYAHVTFFFNGGIEEPNSGEDRVLIPSPKVATYDLQPEMSAPETTNRVISEICRDYYDVIILNYANPDMVGHTGVLDAAIKAVTVVDRCLKQVVDAVLERKGAAVVTGDHGNAEMMLEEDSEDPHTAHTTNPVPFILVGESYRGANLKEGGALEDIAPTILDILGVSKPSEMTGASLILD
jgi:2,3-bisphosphoglycerate-independent phosphoglycerate mutase